MPKPVQLTSQIEILVNGQELAHELSQNLLDVVVDQHCHLPGMFTIRILDPDLKLINEGVLDLTKEIEIKAETQAGKKVTLIKGEVTALEPAFYEGMIAQLVARGYDKSHRLYRETRSMAHLNKKDSDLASAIAQSAGLQAEVQSTSIVHDHIFQHNQSDLAFLMQRAWRIGYECFVSDGKLFFRKPPDGSASLTLTWGEDLLTFHPRMTLAEQVSEVIVKGWDPQKQEAIVGRASQGKLYPHIGESKDGAAWAQAFGTGKVVITDLPVNSQAEADELAGARLDELSGAFLQAEGEAFRRPDVCAGEVIQIKSLGERFSGAYLVTQATHTYTPEGLKTRFSVRGVRSGLLSDSPGSQLAQEHWSGVVIGVVTNSDDPNSWGRVKVKFPWMSAEDESNWARVMGAGAGPQAGFYAIPDVGDEVLVAFEHGDFNHPYVLGGLWNGKQEVPPPAGQAGSGETPLVRVWRSRKGHQVALLDTNDNKIEIQTAGGRSVTLDDAGKTITVKTSGVKITLDDSKLQIESNSQIQIKSSSNLDIEADGNLNIKAGGQVNIKGAMINLN
jgi:phage protein D/phage baseplate assembly protein gpV